MRKIVYKLTATFILFTSVLNADIVTGLVSNYKFDGDVNDSSSYGAHLIEPVKAAYEQGVLGQAYVFNGIDNDLSVSTSLSVTDQMTVSFWIKGSSAAPDMSSFSGQVYDISLDTESTIADFALYDSGQTDVTFSYIDQSNSGWHHVAAVVNSIENSVSIYFDGVLRYQVTGMSSIIDLFNNIAWGEKSLSFHAASIDDVRIYGKELTPSDITTLYSLRDLHLDSGWHFISMPTPNTVCESTIQYMLTSICDQDNTLENIFGSTDIDYMFKYTDEWLYWQKDTNKSTYTNINRFQVLSNTEGVAVKVNTPTTIAFPVVDNNSSEFADLYRKGWHLVGVNESKTVEEINTLVSNQTKTLHYMWVYRAGTWYLYAPQNDADITNTIPRATEVSQTESFWILVD
ncbi:MAG: LamG domain-containing protein [Campylobacterota bacterium]|nr:LamG domain-containing protein [Campylobacterota bacterium]